MSHPAAGGAGKAVRIDLFDVKSIPMRTFHASWMAFFVCFFGWFGVAPLMAVVREELSLSREQVMSTVIASVAATAFARVVVGRLCDRQGPRRVYALLLVLGAIPVMSLGLADDYESFLLLRLAIGSVGAAFVVTQFHTSQMFAPACVGTANATTAGWGNLGGGATQLLMPLAFGALLACGVSRAASWRLVMVVPGLLMILAGLCYYVVTRDTPAGDFRDGPRRAEGGKAGLLVAARDPRAWCLFVAYAACFGVELTLHNVAALYFLDTFGASLAVSGAIAASFGAMNVFTRTLGGWVSDTAGRRVGLLGRSLVLFVLLLLEGAALLAFSRIDTFGWAIAGLVLVALFVQMSSGATFAVVPFVNRSALGSVAGIVGAGGNVGAVLAALLLRGEGIDYRQGIFLLGLAVVCCAALVPCVRFSVDDDADARRAGSVGSVLPASSPG